MKIENPLKKYSVNLTEEQKWDIENLVVFAGIMAAFYGLPILASYANYLGR